MSSVQPRRGPRVLIAEDHVDHAFFLSEALAEAGIGENVTHVLNGAECLERLGLAASDKADARCADAPDFLLLDIRMPKIDGFGVLEALRKDARYADLPVVVLSTSAELSDIQRMRRLGASTCLTKPVGFDGYITLATELRDWWCGDGALPRAGSARL